MGHRVKLVTLGDVISLQRGYDLPEANRRDGEIPIYGSAGINGYHDSARASGEGVTIGRSGASFGVVNYSRNPYWPHNTVLFVTDFNGNYAKYVYYLLFTLDMKSLNSGSAQPSLNRNYLYPIPVRIHEKQDQRRIASILSAYDDLIENNTRRIKILEKMTRSIYREWFVYFRFPGHEKIKFVDSPQGRLPRTWSAGTLGDLLTLQRGYDLPERERKPGAIPIVSSSGVTGTHDAAKESPPGVVTGRYGTLGEVFMVHEPFWPLNTTLYVRDFKGNDPYFVYHLLGSLDLSKQNAAGAVPGLNRNALHLLPAVAPPLDIQKKFGQLSSEFLSLIRSLQAKNANLRQTRDLLLPKLMSGEIDVSALPDPGA